MKVDIETDIPLTGFGQDAVGNVYQVRGGMGARRGHMHIIVAAYEYNDGCGSGCGYATITVDRDGAIVGANAYAQHYFDSKVPIAKCEGLDQVHLIVKSL